MSFSAHRPGRFGSDGRIEFTTDDDREPQYLDDILAQQRDDADASADTVTSEDPTEPWGAPPAGDDDTAPFEWPEDTESAADPQPVGAPVPLDSAPESVEPVPPAAEPEPVVPEAAPFPAPVASTPRPPRLRRADPRRPSLSLVRRMAVLGGADNDVLDEVPEEVPRFVQMFLVLAGTALVSALSMMFALLTGVRISIFLAIPLALVWGLIIFNLDRFLTSTMRSTTNVFRLLGLAFPRIIMAALIGIVVAEPLVLQVFQNDINREVNSTNVTQALTDQDAVTNGPEKQALDAASAQVAALENQAATGIVAGTSSTSAEAAAAQQTVDQLTQQLAAQQAVIDQARAVYQCELTGQGAGEVAGCTGVAGDGASSEAAKAQLAQAQSSYDALSAQLQQAQTSLAAANSAGADAAAASADQNKQQAEDQLPAARAQYESALTAYNDRASSVANGNAGAVGLLSQISALERLSEREPTLRWAHWLIAALFFMIELLPVLVKVLTGFGGPSLYEKAERMRGQIALDRVTARTFRKRADVIADEAARVPAGV
ncbi:MAG: hypothetical protein BGO45_16270 [Microbacterium sp. 71-36]|uniref:DUF4407 domain-containing protein n=1 Tax=unclassified Microbacterium TaxID=2609290 RepID=UPI00086D6EAD|nr:MULTISPECIES: DUF4407 domain-containing protein [unclassified Microbacterium]MBN9211736.1 DUF4407 domain-containing protein [Microbacterium sp.]ODT37414.1 MAG: hypothetical protein ABS60_13195 [Microbacterium sp. SCN 71-17]OJV78213.1 MAG: hypothetical protein BGO45_16270 [Microbacterium sp. 71-36]